MGAMTAIAATGALASGIQAISGAKQRRDARTALENYQRQDLENVAEGLQVSTLGADLQREEQARLASSQVGALQGAGVRGLVGGLGRVEAGNQMANREIAANLDAQQRQIDQMYAQDEANIRGMQEQREMGDIAGLSSQYNAGNAMMWQGIGGIAQSGMSALSNPKLWGGEGGKVGEGVVDTANKTASTAPQGATMFDIYKQQSEAMRNLGSVPQAQATSNNVGYVPQNMTGFLMNQFYSPNQRGN
jgi:hypothetical protein